MPSYPHGAMSGDIASFRDFAALSAAYHHGQRADVTGQLKISIDADKAEIVRMGKLTKAQWQEAADAEYAQHIKENAELAVRAAISEQRRKAMLDQVSAWTPPTPGHAGLKAKMIEDLSGRGSNCCEAASRHPEPVTGDEWYWSRLSMLSRRIAANEGALVTERAALANQKAWFDQLIASLPPSA